MPVKSATNTSNFRARYGALEERRVVLKKRLSRLGDTVHAKPAFKSATKLLNERFQAARVAQRGAILDAASWLIDLLSVTPL